MLVYGDPRFETTSTEFLHELVRDAAYTDPPELDWLRVLLIRAGQLEQALEDTKEHGTRTLAALVRIRRVTDSAAAVFVEAWLGRSRKASWEKFRAQLARCAKTHPELGVSVKVPEGFEYYALYPEAYAHSAQLWAQERVASSARRVLVLGLRSIGTSLSSVVSVVLRQQGWRVVRKTVRPQGHPFDRKSNLGRGLTGNFAAGLVVDEGPGMSGSSMVSAYDWLRAQGLQDITFFPGHNGSPGAAASARIRELWNEVPRFVTPWDKTQWQGKSLIEILKEATLEQCNEIIGSNVQVEDISGGKWRKLAFPDSNSTPSFSAPFERVKLLLRGDRGKAVLWKFTGLGARRHLDYAARCAQIQETQNSRRPKVLAQKLGFTATEWVEGQRLKPEDGKSSDVLRVLSDYLVRSAIQPISDVEHRQGVRRLEEMAWWNIREAFGEHAAINVRPWSVAALESKPKRAYGDGRMAPHEWVRTPAGRIVKTGTNGPGGDHTLVGVQSFAWDLAGLMVEWQMDEPRQRWVYEAVQPAGLHVTEDALRFYVLAYLAFRIGMLRLVHEQVDVEEQARIAQEWSYYTHVFQAL